MEREPFTPAGILALQQWLYELPQAQFNAEILAMETTFEAWSLLHLELTPQQLSFYNQLSLVAKNNLAYTVTLGAAYKRPISLVQFQQNSSTADPDPEEDKLFKPKSSLAVTSHSDGTYQVDGELVIEVVYIG